MRKLFLYLVLPTLLVGCGAFSKQSVIQGRDKHYLTANSAPALRIPPGLASYGIHNQYVIPKRQYPDNQKTVSIVPPGLA